MVPLFLILSVPEPSYWFLSIYISDSESPRFALTLRDAANLPLWTERPAPMPCWRLVTFKFTLPAIWFVLVWVSVMRLMIPPAPSASNFEPGSVITSIFLIEEAGIALRRSEGFSESIVLRRPFIYTSKLLLPLIEIWSSPSTVTPGTLRSISRTVAVLLSGSPSALYLILPASAETRAFWAVTVTSASLSTLSAIRILPRLIEFCEDETVNLWLTWFLPTERITA